MNDPSHELPPTSEEDVEFSQFLEHTLAPGPLQLNEARRQAVLHSFESATHAKKTARSPGNIVLIGLGVAAAACVAVFLIWNRGPASVKDGIAKDGTPTPPAHATSQQSLDQANFRLALLNSQLADMERQLAWLDAREFHKQQGKK